MSIWLVLLAMALVTYLLRASFLLLPPQVEGCGDVPGGAAVDVAVAMRLDSFAEGGISGHVPQLDQ